MMRRWASDNNLTNKSNLSHVLMEGGVLSIPCDKIDEFYRRCIDDVRAKKNIFVVEQKTEIYNFFLDIDYIDEDSLELNQIKSIVKVICDKVNTLGGTDCLISVCEPKPKNGRVKTGVHMNWPDFPVNQEGALNIRDHVVSILKTAYGSKSWGDMIVGSVDDSVYGVLGKTKGSGFRMPWSHKCVKNRATGDQVIEGPYLPFMLYRGTKGQGPFVLTGTIEFTTQDISLHMLKLSTVRSESQSATEIPPIPGGIRKTEGGFTSTQTKNEVVDSSHLAYVQSFIRLHVEGQADSQVKRLFKSKDIYLVETDSMYCENLGRKHNSNHVWFIIQGGLIRQRCFCRCDTMEGRRRGFCKDFAGQEHRLPHSLIMELFPTMKKNHDNIKAAILPNAVINFGRSIASNSLSIYTQHF
jgi:hypothetical protein